MSEFEAKMQDLLQILERAGHTCNASWADSPVDKVGEIILTHATEYHPQENGRTQAILPVRDEPDIYISITYTPDSYEDVNFGADLEVKKVRRVIEVVEVYE